MKWKFGFNLLSKICMILFYIIALLLVITTLEHVSLIWFADSALAKAFRPYEPIFSYVQLTFQNQPDLYDEKSFLTLSFISMITNLLFLMLFLWLMRKLLKNIYLKSLFLYQNVSIIWRLGIITIILGTASTYIDEQITSRTLDLLKISNATIDYSTLNYIDTLIGGIILILIASALKYAVNAVEENEQTI
ncbi:DUF2975 domain-containing protein [Bacillus sp. es.036]|uniref:DUF2975 domain-containing protein n=1 Tax=Bacillus sp. es.036 TaxID=1761764 RepID=UPI000BF3D0BC|nr:DUF2975 domain-containing protein [Bacillus sp. es.036]PFG12427.1 Protein of unknown function (DUF2975) [Bacillus sp. es.036]